MCLNKEKKFKNVYQATISYIHIYKYIVAQKMYTVFTVYFTCQSLYTFLGHSVCIYIYMYIQQTLVLRD
jgi:hypothetical protein